MGQHELFFNGLVVQAETYIAQLGIAITEKLRVTNESSQLYEITSFIQVSGAVQGGYILSIETELAHELVYRFMADPPDETEVPEMALEVAAEMSNIILGNSLIERKRNDIQIGNPLMIVTKQSEIKPKSAICNQAVWHTEYGHFRVLFFPMQTKAELASILPFETD